PLFRVIEDNRQRAVPDDPLSFKFGYFSDMYDNIRLLDGALPSDEAKDGVYEVIVTQQTMYAYHLAVGDVFVVESKKLGDRSIKTIRIVGVFEIDNKNPLYWADNLSQYNRNIYLSSGLFEQEFLEDFLIDKTLWHYYMDYHRINVDNVEHVYAGYDGLAAYIKNKGFMTYIPTISSLPSYKQQQARLTPLLMALYVPIIIMLLLYLYMVSALVVERQRNEISVLISRGAGRGQLMLTYFIESLILGGLGLAVGPLLAIFFTRMLGSTSNFLEFVDRGALKIHFNAQTLYFSVAGVVLSIIMTMLPTYSATRVNIVEHKRNITRQSKAPLWRKYFIDILILAVSIYGYYRFTVRQKDLIQTGAESMSIDPLLFAVPALFTLGLAMIFIRLFPYIVEGLYRLGRRFWPLSIYTSLIQVARSANAYRFLTLFIVMTVSTSIFSATSARTINQNARDKIRYARGADHILTAIWTGEGVPSGGSAPPPGSGAPMPEETPAAGSKMPHYEEPPYVFEDLAGVESAAKVLDTEARFYRGSTTYYARLLGIEPAAFARTAWYPSGLGKRHWYYDINQMSYSESMVLISRNVAEKLNLKLWDTFTIYWPPNGMAQVMVAGIIDYWPTYNPNVKLDRDNKVYDMLVVAHLSYLTENSIVQPYDVWLRMKEGAATEELYRDIVDKKVRISRITDINEDYIKLSRDPVQMGLNGALTLVFIISVLIILSGFLIFWILAMYARMFQSGIMMAMGIKLRELLTMMTWEQLLTSVIPMLFGVVVGGVSSSLFVPMLQMSFAAKDQIPPFRVIAFAGDYIRIYVILGILVLAGLSIIGFMLSRLKIFSCIKMGENS
ncbi:MAG TPA: FtsX-like permease family protein, partial [Candidatus Atribacteria bacterium]|nr:FtsX-like permease family protein [Candidatus Atribacteria bacterium]